MKQFFQLVCILVISIQYSVGQVAPPARDSFQNPFSISLADPYVLYEDGGGYYMYGTGGGAEKGFSAYFSTDLGVRCILATMKMDGEWATTGRLRCIR